MIARRLQRFYLSHPPARRVWKQRVRTEIQSTAAPSDAKEKSAFLEGWRAGIAKHKRVPLQKQPGVL